MHTHLSPKALKSSPRDQTLLIEVDEKSSQAFILKMLNWNQITQDPKWNLQNAFQPEIEEPPKTLQIVEHMDGSVDLQFTRVESSTSAKPGPSTKYEPSTILPSTNLEQPSTSFEEVKFGRPIPQPFYSKTKNNLYLLLIRI